MRWKQHILAVQECFVKVKVWLLITTPQSIPSPTEKPQNINPIHSLLIQAFMLTVLPSTEREDFRESWYKHTDLHWLQKHKILEPRTRIQSITRWLNWFAKVITGHTIHQGEVFDVLINGFTAELDDRIDSALCNLDYSTSWEKNSSVAAGQAKRCDRRGLPLLFYTGVLHSTEVKIKVDHITQFTPYRKETETRRLP